MTDFLNTFDFSRLTDLLGYDSASPLLFNTGLFLILFTLFLIVYEWVKRNANLKMVVTIIFSLYFYYKSSASCVFILGGICVSDWLCGMWLGKIKQRGKGVVLLNVLINLGLLVYFKYFNLLYETWASLTHSDFDPLNIVLPAGISFFTFRSISYMVDIYRGQVEPERNLLRYAFTLTFFPPLLAGPVVRAKDLLPQVRENKPATNAMIAEGFILIMCGLIKKMVIADYLSGNFVNRIFENPMLYSGFENLMGCLGFTLQIYCDFSGYSDMAIGLALVLGYRFKDNFNAPFKSQNPSEFWRRWHISLSTWLRDYLYIPLGGNRKGKARTYLNNFITMVLGGLWHGAGYMYLLWGAYQGLLIAVHKAFKGVWSLPQRLKGTRLIVIVNITITFILSLLGFTIFRATSVENLEEVLTQVFTDFHPSVIPQFVTAYATVVITIVAGYVLHFLPTRLNGKLQALYGSLPLLVQGLILAAVIFLAIQVRSADLVPFIYLQY